jgi:hypothetical protein
MTNWLREIHKNVAFDIIDHSLLLEKHMCYGFTPPAILLIELFV